MLSSELRERLVPAKVLILRLPYLCAAFALPASLAANLWPDQGGSGLWKVAAVMLGGSLFVAMKVFYCFVVLCKTEVELPETHE
jgi:hypothetical protein